MKFEMFFSFFSFRRLVVDLLPAIRTLGNGDCRFGRLFDSSKDPAYPPYQINEKHYSSAS